MDPKKYDSSWGTAYQGWSFSSSKTKKRYVEIKPHGFLSVKHVLYQKMGYVREAQI